MCRRFVLIYRRSECIFLRPPHLWIQCVVMVLVRVQCYRQWLYRAPLCITLKIKIWVVAYLKFIIFFGMTKSNWEMKWELWNNTMSMDIIQSVCVFILWFSLKNGKLIVLDNLCSVLWVKAKSKIMHILVTITSKVILFQIFIFISERWKTWHIQCLSGCCFSSD